MEKADKKIRSNARSKQSGTVRVRSFGIVKPSKEFRKLIHDQARKANEFQAELVRIETDRRGRSRALMRASSKDYDAACNAVTEAETADNEARTALSKRKDDADLKEACVASKGRLKLAWAARSVAYKEASAPLAPFRDAVKKSVAAEFERLAPQGPKQKAEIRSRVTADVLTTDGVLPLFVQLVESDSIAHELVKAARRIAATPGLINDTKELAREAYLKAESDTASTGAPMRTPRGSLGRVGIMFKKYSTPTVSEHGTVSSEAFTLTDREDNRAPSRRKETRRFMRFQLSIGRAVAEANVVAHRPLPHGAQVNRVWVMASRPGAGVRVEYSLQLVLRSDALDRVACSRLASVECKPTWKLNADGSITSVEWTGSDGATGSMSLDARTNEALTKVEVIQKVIDDNFQTARDRLLDWSKANAESVPWLAEALHGCANWHAPWRLSEVVRRLVSESAVDIGSIWAAYKKSMVAKRVDVVSEAAGHGVDLKQEGPVLFHSYDVIDEAAARHGIDDDLDRLVFWLECWRRKNNHLRKYATAMRVTALRRRKDGYRVAAKDLASRYETLSILAVQLQKTPKRKRKSKATSSENAIAAQVEKQQRAAAPSEALEALANAFRTKVKESRKAMTQ